MPIFTKGYSTGSGGITRMLGLNADANLKFEEIALTLEAKISDSTMFSIF